MTNINDIDNAAKKFPCEVFIKVIGKKNDQFELAVLTIIKQHIPNLAEDAIKNTPSKNNNYLSITVRVMAENQEQLDAVYKDLSLCEQVIMAL